MMAAPMGVEISLKVMFRRFDLPGARLRLF